MQYECVNLTLDDKFAVTGMLDEWRSKAGDRLPKGIWQIDPTDFSEYVDYINTPVKSDVGTVHTFFARNNNTRAMVGAVEVTIYDGVCPQNRGNLLIALRPTHRGFGFSKGLLEAALVTCRSLKLPAPIVATEDRDSSFNRLINVYNQQNVVASEGYHRCILSLQPVV
ncbi:MAG: hypothetical protein NC548_10875 [Lachnospiraceae bacterium]|nr:hypothetical protein [Lachnospiraceae bacterium]